MKITSHNTSYISSSIESVTGVLVAVKFARASILDCSSARMRNYPNDRLLVVLIPRGRVGEL